MGYFTGLLGGFNARKDQVREENFLRERESAAQESRIFETLMNADDPEIRSLAVAGLLDTANPRRKAKGIRGWIGETQASPYMERIRALMNTPVTETETTLPATRVPTAREPEPLPPSGRGNIPPAPFDQLGPSTPPPAPSTYMPGVAQVTTPPAAAGSAAQPTASAVDPKVQAAGGPPPLASTGIASPPPGAGAPPAAGPPPRPSAATEAVPSQTTTTSRPRDVFVSPEERTKRMAIAKAEADVEGEFRGLVAAGYTPEFARELIKQTYYSRAYGGSAAMRASSIAGEAPDAHGVYQPAFGIFSPALQQYINPDTQQPIRGFRPRATQSFGVDREALARSMFGRPFSGLNQEESAAVITAEQDQLRREAYQRTIGVGQAGMDKPADLNTARENNVPVGTTPNQVGGQLVPNQAVVDRGRSVQTVRDQLEHIRTLLAPLPKSDELAGLAPGAAYAVRRRSPQYREQIAALESAVNNIVNVMARSVGEQRGTQTEQDALRAEAAIVQLRDQFLAGDTQESAGRRIDESIAMLDQLLTRLPQPPVPTPTPGASATPPPAPTTPPPGGRPVNAAGPAGWRVTPDGRLIPPPAAPAPGAAAGAR